MTGPAEGGQDETRPGGPPPARDDARAQKFQAIKDALVPNEEGKIDPRRLALAGYDVLDITPGPNISPEDMERLESLQGFLQSLNPALPNREEPLAQHLAGMNIEDSKDFATSFLGGMYSPEDIDAIHAKSELIARQEPPRPSDESAGDTSGTPSGEGRPAGEPRPDAEPEPVLGKYEDISEDSQTAIRELGMEDVFREGIPLINKFSRGLALTDQEQAQLDRWAEVIQARSQDNEKLVTVLENLGIDPAKLGKKPEGQQQEDDSDSPLTAQDKADEKSGKMPRSVVSLLRKMRSKNHAEREAAVSEWNKRWSHFLQKRPVKWTITAFFLAAVISMGTALWISRMGTGIGKQAGR